MTQEQKIDYLVTQALHAFAMAQQQGVEPNGWLRRAMQHGLAQLEMVQLFKQSEANLHRFAELFDGEYGVFFKDDADAMNHALGAMLDLLPEEAEASFAYVPHNDPEFRLRIVT